MRNYQPNTVCHFEISGQELGPLHSFYERVFDWRITAKGPGFALVETPAGPQGSIAEQEAPAIGVSFVVTNLAEAVERARLAGGEVIAPAVDNGWVQKAVVADPAGNRITLIQA